MSSLHATVGGVAIGAGSNAGIGGGIGFISFIVPSGATYQLSQNTVVTATLEKWVELR
ncbi:hypothetical protein GW830_03415 [bacterium]|nr:hypothetical protein [bacterium]